MTPEAKVKERAKKYLDAYHVYYFFPVASIFARKGIPDIVCCAAGFFLGIECKAGNNKPTKRQEYEMQCIRDARGFVVVVNETTVDDLPMILEKLGCSLREKTV